MVPNNSQKYFILLIFNTARQKWVFCFKLIDAMSKFLMFILNTLQEDSFGNASYTAYEAVVTTNSLSC